MTNQDLTAKVRELKELKTMQDELSQEIAAIEDTIKAEMTARETNEIIVDVYKIRWTPVISNRFDSTSFQKTHKELYEQYLKKVESRRFSIA